MCKAAHEDGGPKRCSADARARAQQSQQQFERLQYWHGELESALDAARTYKSEAAFRAALNSKLSALAQRTGGSQQDLSRRFALQLFVSRLFDRDPARWLVTGGTALQFRTPQEARPTADLDLALRETTADLQTALGDATRRRAGEHGDFVVAVHPGDSPAAFSGKITYQLGGTRFAVAKLDVVAGRRFPFAADVLRPPLVVAIDDLRPMAEVRTYPVASHVADKVAAMYELHGANGTSSSTRSHDLADITILARCCSVQAQDLRAAVRAEELRRGIRVPSQLRLPSEAWRQTYPSRVRDAGLPDALRDVGSALDLANRFVGAVLAGRVTSGRWDPGLGRWV